MQEDPLAWSGKSGGLGHINLDVFGTNDDLRKLGEMRAAAAEKRPSTARADCFGNRGMSANTLPYSIEIERAQITELAQMVTERVQATEVNEFARKESLEAKMEMEPQNMKELGAVAQSMVVPALATAMRRVRDKEAAQVALEDVVGELAAYVDQIFLSLTARLEAMERRYTDGTVLAASAQLQQLGEPNMQELVEDLEAKLIRTEAKLMCGLETSNKRWKDEIRVLWEAMDSHTHDVNVDGSESVASVHPHEYEVYNQKSPLDLTHVIDQSASSAIVLSDDSHLSLLPPGPPLPPENPSRQSGKQVGHSSYSPPYSSVTQSPARTDARPLKNDLAASLETRPRSLPDWVWPNVNLNSSRAPAGQSASSPVTSAAPPVVASNGGSYRVSTASNGGRLSNGGSYRVAPAPSSPVMVARTSPVGSSRPSLSTAMSAMSGAQSPNLMPRAPASPSMATRSPVSPVMVTRVPSSSPVMVPRASRGESTMSPPAAKAGATPKVSTREFTDDVRVMVSGGTAPSSSPRPGDMVVSPTLAPTLAALAKSLAGTPESVSRGEVRGELQLQVPGGKSSPRQSRGGVPQNLRSTLPPKVASATTLGLTVNSQPQRVSLPTRYM